MLWNRMKLVDVVKRTCFSIIIIIVIIWRFSFTVGIRACHWTYSTVVHRLSPFTRVHGNRSFSISATYWDRGLIHLWWQPNDRFRSCRHDVRITRRTTFEGIFGFYCLSERAKNKKRIEWNQLQLTLFFLSIFNKVLIESRNYFLILKYYNGKYKKSFGGIGTLTFLFHRIFQYCSVLLTKW